MVSVGLQTVILMPAFRVYNAPLPLYLSHFVVARRQSRNVKRRVDGTRRRHQYWGGVRLDLLGPRADIMILSFDFLCVYSLEARGEAAPQSPSLVIT